MKTLIHNPSLTESLDTTDQRSSIKPHQIQEIIIPTPQAINLACLHSTLLLFLKMATSPPGWFHSFSRLWVVWIIIKIPPPLPETLSTPPLELLQLRHQSPNTFDDLLPTNLSRFLHSFQLNFHINELSSSTCCEKLFCSLTYLTCTTQFWLGHPVRNQKTKTQAWSSKNGYSSKKIPFSSLTSTTTRNILGICYQTSRSRQLALAHSFTGLSAIDTHLIGWRKASLIISFRKGLSSHSMDKLTWFNR